MMDLRTTYLGLTLPSPLIAGACPITADPDIAKALQEAGAGAIVMPSLFQEELEREQVSMHHHVSVHDDAHPEATSYFPDSADYDLGSDRYLEDIAALKRVLTVPLVASLNGATAGGWVHHARDMAHAGADAIELNLYDLATAPEVPGSEVEQRYVDVARSVAEEVEVPVAVKVSAFLSAPVHLARRLDAAGAAGLVMFNRFYQPDIDVENLAVEPTLHLSEPHELSLRVRWIAATFGHVDCSLALTGGAHDGLGIIKGMMAGADAVQMASALLRHGPDRVRTALAEVSAFLEAHEYTSARQMVGSMSLQRCPDPTGFERSNYMRVLRSWRFGVST